MFVIRSNLWTHAVLASFNQTMRQEAAESHTDLQDSHQAYVEGRTEEYAACTGFYIGLSKMVQLSWVGGTLGTDMMIMDIGFSLTTSMTTAVAQYPVGEIPDGLRKWAAENKFLLMTRRSKLLSFLGLPTVRSINTISSLRMKTAHNTRQGECFWVKVDKLVSLHTSFGLACWCDNDKLKKEIKYSANIEFLYFEELTDNEKEMLTS